MGVRRGHGIAVCHDDMFAIPVKLRGNQNDLSIRDRVNRSAGGVGEIKCRVPAGRELGNAKGCEWPAETGGGHHSINRGSLGIQVYLGRAKTSLRLRHDNSRKECDADKRYADDLRKRLTFNFLADDAA